MGELSNHQALVLTQLTALTRCEFDIYSVEGSLIGAVNTDDGALSRAFNGPRHLTVTDSDGSVYVRIHDPLNLGRDRYQVLGPDESTLAVVVREITLLKKRLTVSVADGTTFTVGEQDLWDRDFVVSGPTGAIARITRSYPGLTDALLGRNRYVLSFSDGVDGTVRRALLGSVIAVELARRKDANSYAPVITGGA